MTWFGYIALAILLLAFYGNFMQVRGIKKVETIDGTPVSPKVKKVMVRGIYVGVCINIFFFLGVLFVGTGTLF